MRVLIFLITILISYNVCASSKETYSVIRNDCPIDESRYVLVTQEGTKVKLKDFIKKVSVIAIWCPFCPPCRKHLKYVDSLFKRHDKDEEVSIFAINISICKGSKEAKELGLTMPMLENGFILARELTDPSCTTYTKLAEAEERIPYFRQGEFSYKLPLLIVIDDNSHIHRYFGFDSNMTEKDFVEKWQNSIELARQGKLTTE